MFDTFTHKCWTTQLPDSPIPAHTAVWRPRRCHAVRGGEKRSHFRRVKAVPRAPGGGAAGAGNSMGEDAVKDSIAVSIS
jgi:hypothetical protein